MRTERLFVYKDFAHAITSRIEEKQSPEEETQLHGPQDLDLVENLKLENKYPGNLAHGLANVIEVGMSDGLTERSTMEGPKMAQPSIYS